MSTLYDSVCSNLGERPASHPFLQCTVQQCTESWLDRLLADMKSLEAASQPPLPKFVVEWRE